MGTGFDYIAFISYKREDERWAKWLQHKLEHYHLPSCLRKERPDLPVRVRPVFRDITDLTGSVLPDAIHESLRASGHLIVLCTPGAARSKWVDSEVAAFISLGRKDRIIPVILDGEPFCKAPDREAFPPSLRQLAAADELLGIRVDEMGQDAAVVKVVSALFGIRFDRLWRRRIRERRRRAGRIAGLAAAFGLLLLSSLSLSKQARTIRQLALTDQALRALDEQDAYQARRLLREAVPRQARLQQRLPAETHWALARALAAGGGILQEGESLVAERLLPGGRLLTVTESVGSNTAYLNEWDLNRGVRIRRIGHRYWGGAPEELGFRFSEDGTTLEDEWGCVYDTADFKPLGEEDGFFPDEANPFPAQKIPRDHLSPDRAFFVTVVDGNRIWVKDLRAAQSPLSRSVVTEACPQDYYYDGEAHFLCPGRPWMASVNCDENLVTLSDRETGRTLAVTDTLDTVSEVVFSPDGRRFLTFGRDEQIRLFRTRTCRLVSETPLYEGYSQFLFSPSGRRILAHDRRGFVYLMDDGLTVLQTNQFDGGINSLAFSPDGKKVGIAGASGNVLVWDTASGEERIFYGHTAEVEQVAFSPDGRLIASVSEDRTVRVWSLDSGRQLACTPEASRLFRSVEFTADGTGLLCQAPGEDDDVRICRWTLPDVSSLVGTLLEGYTTIR